MKLITKLLLICLSTVPLLFAIYPNKVLAKNANALNNSTTVSKSISDKKAKRHVTPPGWTHGKKNWLAG